MTHDLIKNTGIQFINIPLKLTEESIRSVVGNFFERKIPGPEGDAYDLVHPLYWSEEDAYIDPETLNNEAKSIYGEVIYERIRRDYITRLPYEEVYKVRGKEAMDVFLGHWIPLPYFRIRSDANNPYHHGPEDWARGVLHKMSPNPDGFTHALTLAFDTSTKHISENQVYSTPKDTDADPSGNIRFKCVSEPTHAPRFFTRHLLNEWAFNLYWLPDVPRSSQAVRDCKIRHLACYHVFLKLLNSNNGFPEVSFLEGKDEIGVCLTLDIGNSRTCGLICELERPYEQGALDFTTSVRRLQIRNLAKPHQITDEPFEMQIAFSEEKFGNPATHHLGSLFNWPSMVRVGNEAIDLTSIFESHDSQATMSSPKRYLWDTNPVKTPWIKVDKEGRMGFHNQVDLRRNALYGLAEFIDNFGNVIAEKERGRKMGATESRYSRSALMTFAIYEIILQAIGQINNTEYRTNMGSTYCRRIIREIIITCPTALTQQEQDILQKSALQAISLIEQTLSETIQLDKITLEPKPIMQGSQEEEDLDKPWKFDEATCSQLTYLYSEIAHKYKNKADLYFRLHGKIRKSSTLPSVRIGSIDIGGGTTDFMICDYIREEGTLIPNIKPKPIFWEGFSVAGDDIARRIIESVFIPEMFRMLQQQNGKSIDQALGKLFGPNMGNQTAQYRVFRRQFANQVAGPFAYEVLRILGINSETNFTINLNEVFDKYPEPQNGLLQYINNEIINITGVEQFELKQVVFNVNRSHAESMIKDVIGDVLSQLGYLVGKFDCDLILLSGRPSKLGITKEILAEGLNFSPGKIISLGEYRFGNWHPFADAGGLVLDPKSTVCVGALVAYLNKTGILPGMRIDLSELNKIKSTAVCLGIWDQVTARISNKDIIFDATQQTGKFIFDGQAVTIGMRQLESEDWIATPIYRFDYASSEAKESIRREGYKLPFTIQISRSDPRSEWIDWDQMIITDAHQNIIDGRWFQFRLFTSPSGEGHWRESGSFITQIQH